jgi:hypothetical protein
LGSILKRSRRFGKGQNYKLFLATEDPSTLLRAGRKHRALSIFFALRSFYIFWPKTKNFPAPEVGDFGGELGGNPKVKRKKAKSKIQKVEQYFTDMQRTEHTESH